MVVGVVKELKPGEKRVALLPAGVAGYVAQGHRVLAERGAGDGSGVPDAAYREAGATVVRDAKRIWAEADLILKVKEPIESEWPLMREGQVVFTYLHLASSEALTRALLERGVTAVAYETVQLADGSLPLLAPMSEVAGRIAIQKAAYCLESKSKGRGILLGGMTGVKPAHVAVVGGGIVGSNAARLAVGAGARVTVLDINPARLLYLHDIMGSQVATLLSNASTIAEEVAQADAVIGAVLVPGARSPVVITREMIKNMPGGAVIVDTAIDQGGCCETSKPTTHEDPVYHVHGVVHYCVTNMPAAVPRTASYGLAGATLAYGLAIASQGIEGAAAADPALKRGVNIHGGHVVHPAVAETFQMPCHDW